MSKKKVSGAKAENRAEFAQRIKSLRQAADLTQKELAEAAGVSRQTISNMERGTVPQQDVLERVLSVLGVDVRQPDFEPQTQMWLTMMGTLIETIPTDVRPPVVDNAIRVLAEGVRAQRPAENVTPIRPGVGGSTETDLHKAPFTGREAATRGNTPVDPERENS